MREWEGRGKGVRGISVVSRVKRGRGGEEDRLWDGES